MKLKYFYSGLAFLPVLFCILAIMALYNVPYAGVSFIREQDKWYISKIDNNQKLSETVKKEHKQIASINGREIGKHDLQKEFDDISDKKEFWHYIDTQRYFWENITADKPLVITFADNSSIWLTTSKMGLWDIFYRAGVMFAAAFITLIIGLSVFMQRQDDEKAIAFLGLIISISIIDIMIGMVTARELAINYPILMLLYIVTGIVMFSVGATLLHFVSIFPHRRRFATPLFIIVIYTGGVIGALCYISKLFYHVYPGMLILSMIISIGMIIHSYLTLNYPEEKAQVKWLLLSIILTLIIFILMYFLPMMLRGGRTISAQWPMLSSLMVPLMMAFAINKYKLMSIDSIFDNTLIYVITIGILSAGDLFIISQLTNLQVFVISQSAAIIIGIWLIIFAYIPVRNMVEKWIKKLLKREDYDINQISIDLSRELLAIDTNQKAYKTACDHIINAIHPKGTNAYIINENGAIETIREDTKNFPMIVPTGQSEPTPLNQLIDAKSLPHNHSGGMYVPVIGSGNKQMGYIVIQNKHSGRLYDNTDIKLLKIASGQLAMAIEALRAREELHKKEIEAAKEKERLSREIHDGIGNNLAQAKILLESNNDPSMIIEKLYPLMDEGLKEIRDLIWVSDKEDIVITELVSYIEAKLSQLQNIVPISIQTNITDKGIRLSAVQKMVILRVVQEAVTNTIKHTQATKISIEIEQDEAKLKVTISDNGKGFDMREEYTGYGIKNMQKRCSEIGARLDITSGINEGTSISIEFTQAS